MTHTPGPWKIREAPSKQERDFAIMVDGGIIAEVFERGGRNYETQIESEANARLIAAAPDLLAALEDIIAYHPYAKCDGRISVTDCTAEPCITATAAIAKAEGD